MLSRLPRLGRSSGYWLINATAASFWALFLPLSPACTPPKLRVDRFCWHDSTKILPRRPSLLLFSFRVNVFHAEHVGAVSTPTGTAHNQFAVGRPSETSFDVRVLLLQLHRQTSCHSTSQPVFRDVVHVGVCRLAGDHGGHLQTSPVLKRQGQPQTHSWSPLLEPLPRPLLRHPKIHRRPLSAFYINWLIVKFDPVSEAGSP